MIAPTNQAEQMFDPLLQTESNILQNNHATDAKVSSSSLIYCLLIIAYGGKVQRWPNVGKKDRASGIDLDDLSS